MKIKQLVKRLKHIEKVYGDMPVILSSDPEGNSYSTIDDKWSFGEIRDERLDGCADNPCIGICIYPFEEFFDDYIKAVKES